LSRKIVLSLIAALAASLSVSAGMAQAGTPFGQTISVRPQPQLKPGGGFAATIAALVEAELAAKEQKAPVSTNPFLTQRPRPNREQVMTGGRPGPKSFGPARSVSG